MGDRGNTEVTHLAPGNLRVYSIRRAFVCVSSLLISDLANVERDGGLNMSGESDSVRMLLSSSYLGMRIFGSYTLWIEVFGGDRFLNDFYVHSMLPIVLYVGEHVTFVGSARDLLRKYALCVPWYPDIKSLLGREVLRLLQAFADGL